MININKIINEEISKYLNENILQEWGNNTPRRRSMGSLGQITNTASNPRSEAPQTQNTAEQQSANGEEVTVGEQPQNNGQQQQQQRVQPAQINWGNNQGDNNNQNQQQTVPNNTENDMGEFQPSRNSNFSKIARSAEYMARSAKYIDNYANRLNRMIQNME